MSTVELEAIAGTIEEAGGVAGALTAAGKPAPDEADCDCLMYALGRKTSSLLLLDGDSRVQVDFKRSEDS